MKELLTYIAKNLVDEPDAVSVTEVTKDTGCVLELRVAPADMGKVIGKQGRTSKEIRALIKAASVGSGTKYSVDIVD